ncbi:hypothetical protein BaRGS_00011106, partial [Batillaria attramentaria]
QVLLIPASSGQLERPVTEAGGVGDRVRCHIVVPARTARSDLTEGQVKRLRETVRCHTVIPAQTDLAERQVQRNGDGLAEEAELLKSGVRKPEG